MMPNVKSDSQNSSGSSAVETYSLLEVSEQELSITENINNFSLISEFWNFLFIVNTCTRKSVMSGVHTDLNETCNSWLLCRYQ